MSVMPWPVPLLSRGSGEQAEEAGHTAGKCGGCGEPIPLEEIAGRLLQAKRGEAAWQESYGRCKRCRKAFFPSLPSLGHQPDDTASPAVLRKMVYAGSHASSFQQASKDLKEEAELGISAQRIMRATKHDRPRARGQARRRNGGLGGTVLAGATGQSAGTSSAGRLRGNGRRRLQIRNRKPSEEE